MKKEKDIKRETLIEVKERLKDLILETEEKMNRDNYTTMLERKIGLQTALCMVADMIWQNGKEAE